MFDFNPRRLNGSVFMEPNTRQQFEGVGSIKFKIVLVDTEMDYRIVIQEIDTGVETVLKEIKNFELAAEFHRRYVHNIIKTNMYKVSEVMNGPKRNKSVVFELSVLPTWSYPTHEE